MASWNGHGDLIRLLIDHGADVSAQTEDGWSALHLASRNGHAGLARMLTEHSTKIATPGSPGPTDHNVNHNNTC